MFLSLLAKMNELVCYNWAFTGRMNTDQLQIFLHKLGQTNTSWILHFKSKDIKGPFVLLLF